MSEAPKQDTQHRIQAAIRAKRDRERDTTLDLEQQEAALLAALEQFDPGAAIQAEPAVPSTGTTTGPGLVFPRIVPAGAVRTLAEQPVPVGDAPAAVSGLSVLAGLRQQAQQRLQDEVAADVVRSQVNTAIDAALKQLFFYLHDVVEQLNVLHPAIDRRYPLIETQVLAGLVWQEGFVDYRTRAQSAGGLVERVSLSYQLACEEALRIRRESLGVERFRNILYDYGLLFSSREFKDAHGQLTHAEFEIPAKLAVNVRWRADFERGEIVFEARNLERFGSTTLSLKPAAVDAALGEEFTRWLLGQPNRFRELARR